MNDELTKLIARIREQATYRIAHGAYAEEPITLTPEDALALVDEIERLHAEIEKLNDDLHWEMKINSALSTGAPI